MVESVPILDTSDPLWYGKNIKKIRTRTKRRSYKYRHGETS
jgi:hypothetical protein